MVHPRAASSLRNLRLAVMRDILQSGAARVNEPWLAQTTTSLIDAKSTRVRLIKDGTLQPT
jgi:hypothetical protein